MDKNSETIIQELIDDEGYVFTYALHDGISVLHNDYGPAVRHPDGYFAWYSFGKRTGSGWLDHV